MARQRNPAEWVEARALFERPGGMRLIARPEGENALWEFPGGRLEPRESPEQALRRLCRQRLGVEVEFQIGQPPFIGSVDEHAVMFRYYTCVISAGELKPLGYAELRWVQGLQLREYIFNEPTQQVVDWLLET